MNAGWTWGGAVCVWN